MCRWLTCLGCYHLDLWDFFLIVSVFLYKGSGFLIQCCSRDYLDDFPAKHVQDHNFDQDRFENFQVSRCRWSIQRLFPVKQSRANLDGETLVSSLAARLMYE